MPSSSDKATLPTTSPPPPLKQKTHTKTTNQVTPLNLTSLPKVESLATLFDILAPALCSLFYPFDTLWKPAFSIPLLPTLLSTFIGRLRLYYLGPSPQGTVSQSVSHGHSHSSGTFESTTKPSAQENTVYTSTYRHIYLPIQTKSPLSSFSHRPLFIFLDFPSKTYDTPIDFE